MSPSVVYPVLIKLQCFYFNGTLKFHPRGLCKLFIGHFKDAQRRDKQRLSWQPIVNKSSLAWLRRFNIKAKRVRFLKWQMVSLRSLIIILDKKVSPKINYLHAFFCRLEPVKTLSLSGSVCKWTVINCWGCMTHCIKKGFAYDHKKILRL